MSIDSSQIGGFAYEVGGYFRPIRALELLDHSTSPTPCMLLDAILRVVDADNYRLLRPTGVIISRFLLSDSLEDFFETFDLEAWYIFAYLIALLPKSSPTDEFGLWSTGLCQEYRVALRRAAKILILASELTKKWFFESLFNASISTGWVEWLQCEWDYLDRLTSNNRDTECNSSNLVGAIGDLVGKYIESLEKRIAELEAVANCVEGLAQPRGIPGASMVMFRESLPILVHDLKMRAHSLKFGWMRDEIVNISHISKFHGVAVDMPKVDMESRRQMFRGVRVCSSPMPTGTEMELEPLDVIDKELRGTSGQEICSSSFTIGDSDEEEGI